MAAFILFSRFFLNKEFNKNHYELSSNIISANKIKSKLKRKLMINLQKLYFNIEINKRLKTHQKKKKNYR